MTAGDELLAVVAGALRRLDERERSRQAERLGTPIVETSGQPTPTQLLMSPETLAATASGRRLRIAR